MFNVHKGKHHALPEANVGGHLQTTPSKPENGVTFNLQEKETSIHCNFV